MSMAQHDLLEFSILFMPFRSSLWGLLLQYICNIADVFQRMMHLLGASRVRIICMVQMLSMCSCVFHGQIWGTPAYLDYKHVLVIASQTRTNRSYVYHAYVHVTCRPSCSGGLQSIRGKSCFQNSWLQEDVLKAK